MELDEHNFQSLFDQLGLPSDEASIREFCATHHLPAEIELPNADFWSEQQARFLHEGWHQDSDWAQVIDQLNTSLRKPSNA